MGDLLTDTKVIEAIENQEGEDNLIRLSSGVVLRGKPANATTLIQVISAFPRPKPPIHRNAIMGRDMENPNDPDYISRVQAWQVEQSNAVLTAFILLGTDMESKPEDVLGPQPVVLNNGKGKDKKTVVIDFLDEYALLNLPMKPQDDRWRYLTWVMTVACQTPADTEKIQEVVGRLSGVSKKDVQAAEEFPGSQKAG
jgi:hypothetical protein